MYRTIQELPARMRDAMPAQACELYMAAYNRVYDKMAAGSAHDDDADIARAAHEGAMFALQAEFELDDTGRWRRAPIGEVMDDIGRADPMRTGQGTGEPDVLSRGD